MEQRELEVSDTSAKPPGLRLELPWPPSANHYNGHRVAGPFIKGKQFVQVYPTFQAKEFHRNVQSIVMRDRAARNWSCPLKMSFWTYPPDRRKRDTSNLFKMLEDALQKSGVFMDDYQIVEHHAYRTSNIVDGGMVVVELEPTVLL
jgi:Holliday junction resolvase RusA-like endonuclease